MKGIIHGAVLLFAIFLSTALFAQDISGNYSLSASGNPGACVWSGQLSLTQSGGNPGTFVGTASANVVSGPCISFSGSVSGNISGSTLDFGVGVGGGGSVAFDGTVTGGDLSGNWSGFGAAGTWSASPVAGPAPGGSTAIPTMSAYGLVLTMLGLLLLAGRRLRVLGKPK
jgi:hypothetical protein